MSKRVSRCPCLATSFLGEARLAASPKSNLDEAKRCESRCEARARCLIIQLDALLDGIDEHLFTAITFETGLNHVIQDATPPLKIFLIKVLVITRVVAHRRTLDLKRKYYFDGFEFGVFLHRKKEFAPLVL